MANKKTELHHQIGEITPDNLIAGLEITPITGGVVIASGVGMLPRGAVLGMKSSGKCALVDSTAEDGSEKPFAILAEDVLADTGDVAATAYKTGVFNRLALTLGGTDTPETHEAELRALGIHLKENEPY